MTASRRDALKGIGAAGALALVGGASAGIGGGTETERVPVMAAQDGEAGAAVRVAHASPDAPAVDVLVDGEPAFTDVEFGDVTEYATVAPGTYTVAVTAAGDPTTVAFEGEVTFDQAFQTVAAIGELTAGTFEPLLLTDYNLAQVRLVHASPDAPAVDVTANDGEVVLFDGVAFGDSTDFVGVPAGSYTLEVRPDTETNDGEVVATFDVTLEGGEAYTAFAEGYVDPANAPVDEPFDLVVALDGIETVEPVCPPCPETPTPTPKTTRTPTAKPTKTTTKRTPKPTKTTTKRTTTKKPTKTTTAKPTTKTPKPLKPVVVKSGCDKRGGFITVTNPNREAVNVVLTGPDGFKKSRVVKPKQTLTQQNLADGDYRVKTFTADGKTLVGKEVVTIKCATPTPKPVKPVRFESGCNERGGFITIKNPNDVPVEVRLSGPGGFSKSRVFQPKQTLTQQSLADGTYRIKTFTTDGELVGTASVTIDCEEKTTKTPKPTMTTHTPPTSTKPPAKPTRTPDDDVPDDAERAREEAQEKAEKAREEGQERAEEARERAEEAAGDDEDDEDEDDEDDE